MNLILTTDSYKLSHYRQYPANTEYVSSYIESRGGEYDKTLFFGMQMFIMKYLLNPVTHKDIMQAEMFTKQHMGDFFNKKDWEYIVNKHNGFLPIEIKAVPEGTLVPTNNVLVQVVNTDPNLPWLTSYVETMLLRGIWYPTTVATNSYYCKQAIYESLVRTADNPDAEILFKLHDFGARGVSSQESAAIGGCAHLVNFRGSDTIEGILAAAEFYSEPMAGYSIPAAEHSTITSWGKSNETAAYDNMLNQFAPTPDATAALKQLVAVVSDSYDIYNACANIWGEALHNKIKQLNNITVVVRPDSGDPLTVPVSCIKILADKVGYTTNTKGYKVLPDYFRVIQGDGISLDSIKTILHNLEAAGFSSSNIAFGMGGKLLQSLDRDTLKFAMKTSAVKIGGYWEDAYKQPVTDTSKNSKRGRLALTKDLKTVREDSCAVSENILQTVYKNGKIMKLENLETIRSRAI
jgi:nicotinamide phosphoribosyltransferase